MSTPDPRTDAPHAEGGASSHSRLPKHVAEAKEELQAAREKVHAAHALGLPAVQVCARLTAAADAVVSRLWRAAADDLAPAAAARLASECVLVAHGGYGRRQLAPNSDIDLMVLHSPAGKAPAEVLSRRLTSELFDVGLELGHSLRTPEQSLQLARRDPMIATSLLESRHVVGSQPLYEKFAEAFRASTQRRGATACAEFVEARHAERKRYGETVYLLEPNIKRSRGALRDIHLLRWLWFVQLGMSELDRIHAAGALSKFDHHRLTSARDFLMRVRNELHFVSPQAGDTLTRHEQLRVAEGLGYQGSEGLRPVEQFMRDYFRHAGFVWFLTRRVSELTTRRKSVARAFQPVLSKSVTNDYRIGFGEIAATDSGRAKLLQSITEVLRLLDLAREQEKWIAQDTWYAVYRGAHDLPDGLSPEAATRFMNALKSPVGLGAYLRRAHDLTVLERVLPAFREVRCLLQFNQYHKFTVDEHTLRAVDIATRFGERQDTLGEAYRGLVDHGLLHLALLLHDVGKGRQGDHSVVGEQMAIEMADRLGLSEERTARLALLVRRHLSMSHLAFRRNTNDPAVIADFARLVGSPETLAMLFVLTCADMAAVGPGVLNDWKVNVLADLYSKTVDRLSDRTLRVEDRRNAVRTAVWQLLNEEERDSTLFKELFATLPESLLPSRSPGALAGVLRRLARVQSGETPPLESVSRTGIDAWGGYESDDATVEMLAGVANGAGRGVFASMAGALSSKGLAILSAETALLAHDVLLLRYTAADPKTAGNAAEANRRIQAIASAMVHSVDSTEPPKLPQVWGADKARAAAALSGMPTEVRIDTALSDDCAIIEVFTIDRVGLLYELAQSLHDSGLVIRFAKIATSLDQVVDVFYVNRHDGTKPSDDELLGEVSRRLMDVIEGE
ncbi:Bifunctional uridylyltransferase/uridylyl-removing enzyme [Botrimarina colliarenosi]|uniref:Bifunctional uridylyltransferase/uridylyl-removing enzyme n=1 Tax=Botrimarina colliarenosi TaxID=2528001 RepID=A0A5C6AF85_9BACT|nr:[protein-PII] uridylyltransferase [Botrimarina colliarenosi]TWT96883.1 Bifunctional uridylyltransferase/uridylyl-removing enzyme [Botrimarina colliarenosi]